MRSLATRFTTTRGAARWAALSVLGLGAGIVALGPSVIGARFGEFHRSVAAAAAGTDDTVTVWGPRTLYGAGPNGTLYYIEQFNLTVTPMKRYTLRVANGAPDGSKRISSGSVTFNGQVVVSNADIAAGGPGWNRVVEARAVDTISAVVQGPLGSFLKIDLVSSSDGSVLVFGFERFSRSTGPAVTYTRSFTISPGVGAPYRLWILNGNADGTQRLSGVTVTLNGVTVVGKPDLTEQMATLMRVISPIQGQNQLVITLPRQHAGFIDLGVTATDATPPVLTITTPAPGLITRDTLVSVTGTVQDQVPVAVTVNGAAAALSGNSYSAAVRLPADGPTTITISAKNTAGLTTDSTRTVIRDTQAPVLTLTTPSDRLITKQTTVTVSGTVTDATPVTVNVNGIPLPVDGAGAFTGSVSLSEGANVLTVTATDAAGNATSQVRIVTRDTQAPVLTVTAPADGATVTTEAVAVQGTATDATAVTLTVNGTSTAVGSDGSFSATVTLAEGLNTITIAATDAAGNNTMVTRSVTRQASNVPPDPSTVATPLDPTVATNFASANAFLYTGANPIQTGVPPGTIISTRAAVIRGKVLTRDGQALSGATVTILGHPEYGQTLSRADGMFDLAVNGGATLTVNYERQGYLPAQRPVGVPWRDYVLVEDAALVQLDPQVTEIDFAQPAEVARGSVVTDQDGTRQVTLIFPQGTVTTVTMADGSMQTLSAIHVRATEYTIGSNGPRAMPAPLPPSSGYTYAVEFSIDEATAAAATAIRFDRPIVSYVENFLRFPVGGRVPVGFYDRATGQWIASDDGRVVRVLQANGGVASLDVDGFGSLSGAGRLRRGAAASRLPVRPGSDVMASTGQPFQPV